MCTHKNLRIHKPYVLNFLIQCNSENAYVMIYMLSRCFLTLTSKCPKGRFVALRFIYISSLKEATIQRHHVISSFSAFTRTRVGVEEKVETIHVNVHP